jgi:hypothetical protein
MTAQYIHDHVVELVSEGRDEAALAIWDDVSASVRDALTNEQFVQVMGLLSSAERVAQAAANDESRLGPLP